MVGLHRPRSREPRDYRKYDHLPVQEALIAAWEDVSLTPLQRSILRVRVWGVHPALAWTMERYSKLRAGLPDPALAPQTTESEKS